MYVSQFLHWNIDHVVLLKQCDIWQKIIFMLDSILGSIFTMMHSSSNSQIFVS